MLLLFLQLCVKSNVFQLKTPYLESYYPQSTAFIFPHDQKLHLEFGSSTRYYMIISTGNGGMMRSTTPLVKQICYPVILSKVI